MVKTIKIPISIVELESFTRAASDTMTAAELEEFKFFIGSNPEAGELIRGTGGVRKVRWATQGRGKSGGARVIYYFHNFEIPLFLITAYRKSDKESLTKRQRNQMATLVKLLIQHYESGD